MATAMNIVGEVYQRPWGSYKAIEMGDGFQVKVITVQPGGKLSLQKHSKRAEHWVVVSGEPTVSVDDDIRSYKVGEHIYIPMQAAHRMENLTAEPATIVEVQVGTYLGEDDIVRLDDVYGRV